ncbi:MAG: methyltransferase domain-containing protein [Bacteroidales bacterium]|jgi:predicted SAM-dependent methyltransferase
MKIIKKIFLFFDVILWNVPTKYYEKYKFNKKLKNAKNKINEFIKNNKIPKLQIGTGGKSHFIDGWLNTCICDSGKTIYLDATKSFPIENNKFDYIFSEHFIEHITFEQAVFHLNECFRILKHGGKIRIVTPNLEALTILHNNNNITEIQKKYLENTYEMWLKSNDFPKQSELFDVFTINNFFYSWGHKFIYDLKTLKYVINKCGFRKIKQCKIGSSEDDNLNGIETHHLDTSIEMNNYESIVVEAIK